MLGSGKGALEPQCHSTSNKENEKQIRYNKFKKIKLLHSNLWHTNKAGHYHTENQRELEKAFKRGGRLIKDV